MRRLWGAAVLLLLVSAALAALGGRVTALTDDLLETLPAALTAAASGDWEAARTGTARAAETWAGAARWLQGAESHQAVEEVGALLEEAMVWARMRDPGAYETAVRRACRALEALSASEKVRAENLF